MSTISADSVLRAALATAPLAPSEERRELASLARGYLAKGFSTNSVRSGEPSDWARMAVEQGWPGLALPEDAGGLGLSFAELAVVVEECGRALAYPELITTSVLGATLLAAAGGSERLAQIASGELTVSVVGGYDIEPATAQWQDGALSGHFPAVVGAAGASLLLVPAHTTDGTALFAVDPADASIAELAVLDLSRPQAGVGLDGAVGELLLAPESFATAWERSRLLALVALAVSQLGAAERALELTLAYVVTREQFGRPIGSFQAIKHRCADLFVELQAARSAVEFAVWAADADHACLALAASIAKAEVSDAFSWIAAETVQLHGGIGFTWEHDAHLYFRRARTDETLLGNAVHHRSRIADLLGLSA